MLLLLISVRTAVLSQVRTNLEKSYFTPGELNFVMFCLSINLASSV